MKKVNISIAYEEEKYAALTMYLTQKNMSLETELTAALDSLYAKQVPPAVRDFESQRISSEQKKEKKKQDKQRTDSVREVRDSASKWK